MIRLDNKNEIAAFLRKNAFFNIYGISDLGDAAWPHTSWFGLAAKEEIKAVAMLYTALRTPTLLALAEERDLPHLKGLLRSVIPLLPEELYCHVSIGLSEILASRYRVASHGEHYKMGLLEQRRLVVDKNSSARVQPLTKEDFEELLDFYTEHFPGHSFEAPTLDAYPCYGLRGNAGLLSVAGTHVYSGEQRVAALGNIVTHRSHRRKGYAGAVVSKLCRELLGTVEHIGLNVHVDNVAAIRCYEGLGFRIVASYEECTLTLRE